MNSIILPSLLQRSSSQYPHFTVGKTGTPGQSDLPQGTLSQWRHSSLLGRQHPNKATDEKMLGAANFQKGYVTSSINFMGFCEDNYLLKEFKKTTSPHQFCLLISFFLYLLLFSYLLLSETALSLLPCSWAALHEFYQFSHWFYLLQESLQLTVKSEETSTLSLTHVETDLLYFIYYVYCLCFRLSHLLGKPFSFNIHSIFLLVHSPSRSSPPIFLSHTGKFSQPTWKEKVWGWLSLLRFLSWPPTKCSALPPGVVRK